MQKILYFRSSSDDHEFLIEKHDFFKESLPGNRIVEIAYVLKWAMNIQFLHSKQCSGVLYPYKELAVGLGIVRKIFFKCTVCDINFEKTTEDPNKKHSVLNMGTVWGNLAIGGTFGHLEEQLACLDIPQISKKVYIQTENTLAQVRTIINMTSV